MNKRSGNQSKKGTNRLSNNLLSVSRTLYDDEGRPIVTVGPFDPGEPNNVGTETVYDALGRVAETRRWANVQINLVPFWVDKDGQGSVRKLADSSGAVTNSYNYDAYGNASTTLLPDNLYYTGQMYDYSLGLYYLRARYYNPKTA